MSKEELAGLLDRKRHFDEKFLYYSRPAVADQNYQALANLALISGRIDALIRQAGVRNREAARLAHRQESK